MKELVLKYGCNPNQSQAKVFMKNGGELPFEVLNGRPGYINLLDALNGFALVSELSRATKLAAAASFKHVSPAGAAVAVGLDEREMASCFAPKEAASSELATAYARARGADRMSSFGDFAVMSQKVDEVTARMLSSEVSDGVIAPDYEPKALEILRGKKGGNYCVLQISPDFVPSEIETKDVYGVSFLQSRNEIEINESFLQNIVTKRKDFPQSAVRDLLVALITLKYTQSNSVCFAFNGGAIGVGAGQQSRIHCTRLAASKADLWFLRQSDEALNLAWAEGVSRAEKNNFIDCYLNAEPQNNAVLQAPIPPLSSEVKARILSQVKGVSLASDAFFPFSDNIERAARSGVEFVCEPGGSVRDDAVISAADEFGMTMAFSGVRLFHH